MKEVEAVNIVMARRRQLEISRSAAHVSSERAIVEYTPDREQPGVVENRPAWIITLASPAGLIKVHVDDLSGQVLEVMQ